MEDTNGGVVLSEDPKRMLTHLFIYLFGPIAHSVHTVSIVKADLASWLRCLAFVSCVNKHLQGFV